MLIWTFELYDHLNRSLRHIFRIIMSLLLSSYSMKFLNLVPIQIRPTDHVLIDITLY